MKEIEFELTGLCKESEEAVKAREKAMVLLNFADYTESAMYERLLKYGYSPEVCAKTVAYLISRKYIDEQKYFERFFEYTASKKYYGKSKIIMAARQKGFSRETIDENFRVLSEDTDFAGLCAEFIKKSRKVDIEDKKSREKLIASLSRRGYSIGEIKQAIEYLRELDY